jgi:hypothetical protein
MHTQVKATSIATYHKTAPERHTLRSRIARYILTRTRQGKPVWRKDIVRALELEASTVAGRVNEIEQQGIELDGLQYRLQYLTNGVKDPVTGKTVEAFALVIDSESQLKFDLV